MAMNIEDFIICGTDDGDVNLLCPDTAGTCPQWQTAMAGSLGNAMEVARNHITTYHPMQAQASCTVCQQAPGYDCRHFEVRPR